jgi:hypothetical protein
MNYLMEQSSCSIQLLSFERAGKVEELVVVVVVVEREGST